MDVGVGGHGALTSKPPRKTEDVAFTQIQRASSRSCTLALITPGCNPAGHLDRAGPE